MFAVIKTGGKQYKVSPGTLLKVERLEGEAGQSVHLSSVLLLNNEGTITVGAPLLDQVQVSATIVEQTRDDKIIVFKKKRRQGYRRKAGHRQDITVLRIEDILTAGKGQTHRKPHETKASSQSSNESIDKTIVADTHTSETVKAPVSKKPKVKKEVETASDHSVPETTMTASTSIDSITKGTSAEPSKKSAKKTSSEAPKTADHDKETLINKDKKKPSSKSSDSK